MNNTPPTETGTPSTDRNLVFGAGLSGLAAARLLRSESQEVLLVDEQGRVKLSRKAAIIEEKELQGSGIRYYQLETSNHTASKKMVLLGTK